jgi:transcriptional regulator with XRE-family HTH domain
MSKFPDWFKREYRRWSRSQPGEEDFLAFCSLLGYTPETVLSWMHGESTPQNGEVLSIAGLFGVKVYKVLGMPEPDKELLKTYESFSNLAGELRSKAAHALWEADVEIKQKQLHPESDEAKAILAKAFDKWGFTVSGN